MTETTTETREETLQALRIIADLHAAYGGGLALRIEDATAPRGAGTWVTIGYGDADVGMTIGLWPDGVVGVGGTDAITGGSKPGTGIMGAIEAARLFLHRYGHGRR